MKGAAYRLLVRLLVVPFVLVLLRRGFRDRGWWRDFSQRFGFGPTRPAGSIWIHAVSVGEVQAAAALVRALQHPPLQRPVTVTTTTPTGAARARALFAARRDATPGAPDAAPVEVRFLPLDTAGSVRRFLDRVQPSIALVIEKEIWPQLFHECTRRQIPVVLASAALAPRAMARYRRLLTIFAGTLTAGLHVAAQSEADAARFAAIGVPAARLQVIGNLKFDLALPEGLAAAGRVWREHYGWQQRFVLVAGSTYEPEEEALLAAQRRLRDAGVDLALVLAPRHPPRFAAVATRLQHAAVAFRRHSQHAAVAFRRHSQPAEAAADPDGGRIDVLLLDTLGDLLQCYAGADAAFVGGSLIEGVGGHNLLEPAALAVPTLTGPHAANAPEIAAALRAQQALAVVHDAESLTAALRLWIDQPALRRQSGERAQQFVARNRGTLQRLLGIVEPLIAAAKLPSTSR